METLAKTIPESNIHLVVEELMPGENHSRVMKRVLRFLNAGVKQVWLLDAEDRAVNVCTRQTLTVVDEDAEEAGEVDRGHFRCTIEDFFGPSPRKFPWHVQGNVRRILERYSQENVPGLVKPPEERLLIGMERSQESILDLCFYPKEGTGHRSQSTGSLPLLAVLIHSPGERLRPVQKQLERYLRLGIPLVWWLHIEERFVGVYQPGEIHRILDGQDQLTGNAVLPDFRCQVADFFRAAGRQQTAPGGSP